MERMNHFFCFCFFQYVGQLHTLDNSSVPGGEEAASDTPRRCDFTKKERKKAPSHRAKHSDEWLTREATMSYCPGRHSQTVQNEGENIQFSPTQRVIKHIKKTKQDKTARRTSLFEAAANDIISRQLQKCLERDSERTQWARSPPPKSHPGPH